MFVLCIFFSNLFSTFFFCAGHCHYYDSECATRSPSPAPSSGVESNSFKDSPIQIDVLSTESSTLGKFATLCIEYISIFNW